MRRTMSNCGNCRFWSEMAAQSIGCGTIEAVCLAPGGKHNGKFMGEAASCASWKSGHHGAVDAPPNYGERQQALYDAEEAGA